MRRLILLEQPTNNEILRIREIMFYWFVKELLKTSNELNVNRVMESYAILIGCPLPAISVATSYVFENMLNPSAKEEAVVIAYLQIPKASMPINPKTYYNHVYKYTEERHRNALYPRAEEHITLAINKFINGLREISQFTQTFIGKDIKYYGE